MPGVPTPSTAAVATLDGQRAVRVTKDGALFVRGLTDGAGDERRVPLARRVWVLVTVSSRGGRALVYLPDGSAHFVDLASGELVALEPWRGEADFEGAFTNDERTFVGYAEDPSANRRAVDAAAWDVKTGRKLWQRRIDGFAAGEHDTTRAFAVTAGGFVTPLPDGRVLVHDARTGRLRGELGAPPPRRPEATAWLADDVLATAGHEHLSFFSLATGERLAVHELPGIVGLRAEAGGRAVFVATSSAADASAGCDPGTLAVAVRRLASPAHPATGPSSTPEPASPEWTSALGSGRTFCLPRDGHEDARPPHGEPRPFDRITAVDLAHGRAVAAFRYESSVAGYALCDLGAARCRHVAEWDAPSFSDGGGSLVAQWGSHTRGTSRLPDTRHGFLLWDTETLGASSQFVGPSAVERSEPEAPETCALGGARPGRAWDLPWADGPVALDDARGLFALSLEARVSLRSLPAGDGVADFEAPAVVSALGFGPRPDELLVATDDGGLHVYRGDRRLASAPGGGRATRIAVRADGLALTIDDDGAMRIWETDPPRLRASLVEYPDGEYLAFTPGGAYRGTPEAAERVVWVFDEPTEPFGFERFAARYERPDIVARRLAGDVADVDAAPRRPPSLELVDVRASAAGGRAALTVRAHGPGRVDWLRAWVEGHPVASQAVCRSDAVVPLEVPLGAGENVVSLAAFDDVGLASNTLSVAIESPSGARGDLWVVAVGVDHYPGLPAELGLSFAAADATGVAAAFSALAGEGRRYRQAHVTVLRDEEATVGAIEGALAELAQMAPDDVAVVALSGHGLEPRPGADMVFATSGVRGVRTAGGALELDADSVARASVGWAKLGDLVAAARGRVLVLLDACHAGHVVQERLVPNDELARGLAAAERAGAFGVAAAEGRQLSYEPSGSRALRLGGRAGDRAADVPASAEPHGLFTAAVLAALASPETDRNGDRSIELSELVDDVTRRVVQATGGRQTPWVVRREMFGDFHLADLPSEPSERP